MTIFFHLVRKILKHQITVAHEKSVALDYGIMNSFLSNFGFGRDVNLSREKREIYNKLKRELDNLQCFDSDNKNIANFRALIGHAKAKAKAKSDEKGLGEGSFGEAMDHILKRLTLIEENLHSMLLWDQQNSHQPHELLFNYIAQYVIQKTIDDYEKNPAQVLRDNPQLTSAQKISKEKDELLRRCMKVCLYRMRLLDRNHEEYSSGIQECILSIIKEIRDGNEKICKKNGVSLKIPIKITLLFSVEIGHDFQPGLGRLEGYMKAAEETILSSLSSNFIHNDEEKNEGEARSAAYPEP